jgi:hypothetical protein
VDRFTRFLFCSCNRVFSNDSIPDIRVHAHACIGFPAFFPARRCSWCISTVSATEYYVLRASINEGWPTHLGVRNGPIFSIWIGPRTLNETCPDGSGGQPNGPTHLLPTSPACTSRRRRHVAHSKILACALLPPEISRGARANVSRRPFPRAHRCFPLVWAAYKSDRRSPAMDTKNPLPARR